MTSSSTTCSARTAGRVPLERALFLMAGTVTLVSALLGALVSPWFGLLAAFVGVNQLLFAALGDCAASLVLRKAFGLRSTTFPRS